MNCDKFGEMPCDRVHNRNYKLLLGDLQNNISITDQPKKLQEALIAARRKYYGKREWEYSVGEILLYVENHKENFKDGKLHI